MFEESLHGVVVGLRQLPDQLFDGLNSMFVVWNLCRTEKIIKYQSLSEKPELVAFNLFPVQQPSFTVLLMQCWETDTLMWEIYRIAIGSHCYRAKLQVLNH